MDLCSLSTLEVLDRFTFRFMPHPQPTFPQPNTRLINQSLCRDSSLSLCIFYVVQSLWPTRQWAQKAVFECHHRARVGEECPPQKNNKNVPFYFGDLEENPVDLSIFIAIILSIGRFFTYVFSIWGYVVILFFCSNKSWACLQIHKVSVFALLFHIYPNRPSG